MNDRKTKFTFDEAVDVWLRYWNGEDRMGIAIDYRINSGRVSEVLNEQKHLGSKQAALAKKTA
ncbi:hypothetical protein [Methylocystis rosea]|uniref:hypothetical protein n=1 Tax=Methylocystis rosea TaxID=173366 RepID=UPI00039CE31E|nr:hypothetical protein [Methylocystis rosea]